MIDKSSLIKLLRAFIATVESLDQQQIDDLFAGKAKLAFAPTGKAKEMNSAQFINKNSLLDKLNQCKDRDEARGVLSAIATQGCSCGFRTYPQGPRRQA